MSSSYQVESVCKSFQTNAFETVTHLCGKTYDGSEWRVPIQDAIEGIRSGRFEFFAVDEHGRKTKLAIARSPYNKFYLKGIGDSNEPRTLLNLPNNQTNPRYC